MLSRCGMRLETRKPRHCCGTCKDNTSKDPFSRCEICKNLVTDENDDHRIQSDYNMNCNTQKERTLHLVLRMRGEDARHQWQRDHQDPEHLPHKAHEHWHVKWMCARFSSLFCSVFVILTPWFAHHIVAQVVRVSHVIHACSERHSSTLSSPFHPTAASSHSPSISRSPCCTSSTTLRAVVTLRTPPKKEEGIHWRVLLTGYGPKNHDFKETYVESLTESLTPPQLPEQRFLADVDFGDTALDEMRHNAHRVHVYHSQREGLSVGQSSLSVSERTGDPLWREQGDLLWKEVKN